MDHIQETFPTAEVVILGNFKVEVFVITHDLTKLIEEPNRLPGNVIYIRNILDL